ncbi:MAG: Dehydrogenases with different specificities (related to short-chain alcohol dehydrogenases) [uncultured Acidimicrobiales bacterium]|uniref:Dehydrogenases with different specificities (Related to short-chain alcohol dehydrogenases) n=1 Tax=uncultured Acidimicrobiales bacterium TaxID=310071 RepID=A0A6J4H8I0_9ACTN|nr:MAG: Dehydrogenases with different specificities (related to short-chain alcohol dehydrogenases) [uncultured Acidimicrobiales bacterium]
MGRLDDKVAVITGGASGIGRAIVQRFLDEGAAVVVGDLNEANSKDLHAEVEAQGRGGKLRLVHTDVSVEADVEALVATAVDEFGRLDVMCNNAGVGGAFGPLTDIAADDWDYTFAVLVRSVFLGTKYATRAFKRQGGGGAIVNTASVAGVTGGSGPHAYSSSKAAVINFTRSAAIELGPLGIRINAICPGGILTPLLHRGDPEGVGERLKSLQPIREAGTPEHIAAAVLFLASDDASFVTGEALVVDGGLLAAGPAIFERLRDEGPSVFSGYAGVSHGSTGEAPTLRPIDGEG